jgi:hypothetical protein
MKSRVRIATAGFLLATALLAGCGTASQSLHMVLAPADVLQMRNFMPDALRGQVALADVSGGSETGLWWGSKVSSLALEHALEETLRDVGLWAMNPPAARYQLKAQMLALSQPLLSLDTTVATAVHYSLIELASGTVLYQRSVRTTYTAEFTEAMLSQPERLRLANEGAIRQTIHVMLRDLPNLRL